MILDNIDEFFEQIQQADKKQCINNFEQTYINSPRNPYTQETYQADRLLGRCHQKGFSETRWLTENDIQTNKLNLKPNEKENFIESDLYQNGQRYRNIKFYNVEQLDKASFDKLPLEIKKPTPNWEKNPKIEKFIESQGVKVLHNSALTPRYNNITHTIHMPHQSQYSSAEKYYNDLFHEIGHSTSKELGREPKSPEQVERFYDRDELVAETSAIKLNKLTQNNFDKEKNLPYLKYYLSKFGDYKDIQKEELGKALIESDKVVELTNNKYISADKSQSISNEINKNENKLSQDGSVKSQDDIFSKALQTAHQKIENKRSISNEINKNENKLSQDHSVKSQEDIFSKAFQTAHQKIENKRSISNEKSINKGVKI